MFREYPYTNLNDLNLDYILKTLKNYIDDIADLKEWRETHEAEYEQLKELYDQIMSGNFPPEVQAAFVRWMRENATDIVGEMIKNVFFGLTDAGYFVAYIPDSWADIIFNTTEYDIVIPLFEEYGHLVLSY